MNRCKIVSFVLLAFLSHACAAVQPWTWCYKKKFMTTSLEQGDQAFVKKKTPHFTQLIFSWNALLLHQGSLQFWVRVHYADTQSWSEWHRMAEWNQRGGKTFYGKHNDGLEYCYVRLEVPKGREANGFHIKVTKQSAASFDALKLITVSISNMKNFEAEHAAAYDHLPSVHIEGVPEWSQMLIDHPRAPSICSPTSLCMLAGYVSDNENLHPYDFANGVFDQGLKVYGSWLCNVAYAYHATDGTILYHVQRLHDFAALYHYLERGMPVVVSVRGVLPGAPKTYYDGHLMTIIGYDANYGKHGAVICHDPRRLNGVEAYYPLVNFLQAWENSHRLAYIAQPIRS